MISLVFITLAIASYTISYFHFQQKGYLLNNEYIYASKEKKATMNKAPYYKQSAVVFLIIGMIFTLNGMDAYFKTSFIFYINLALLAILFCFVIKSSIQLEKDKKNSNHSN